jgi:YD repeat-containing protein
MQYTYQYDNNGRMRYVFDALMQKTEYQYDAKGNRQVPRARVPADYRKWDY